MLALLAILTVTAAGPLGVLCAGPRVDISGLGAVVGETVHFQRNTYPILDTYVDVYRGIPFAEPPERFAKPQPKKPWSGDLDATKFGTQCPQPLVSTNTGEDCLNMNIWVPNPKPTKAAVMLFIHGGAFLVGSGSEETYNGISLAAYRDVIVVTFNYRLGVFGFLSTGDGELPGNNGMWDQLEALKWVKEHIADFGGDSNRITIFGESAGGVSVSLMTLAKQSWGYYDRAIMQSGTATAPWGVLDPTKARDDAFGLGRNALCFAFGSSSSLVSCLKTKTTDEIMSAATPILLAALFTKNNLIPFVPTIDGEFLTKDPAELFRLGEFKSSDVLLGTQRDEGAMIALKAFLPASLGSDPVISKDQFDGSLSSYVFMEHDQSMLDVISAYYTDSTQSNYLRPFSRLTTDEGFTCPTDTVVKAFAAANSNTYLYQMTHVSSFHFVPLPTWADIVPHADDLVYVFGSTFMSGLERPVLLTAEEVDISVDMMRYWTNFAKTGNPNLESLNHVETPDAKTWHKFNTQTMYYKDLSPSMVDRQNLLKDECDLWNVQLPNMAPRHASRHAGVVSSDLLSFLMIGHN
ncbi:cholinesterase 1-like isoform X2 [Patiria miniata]|uniref:Carboxylic ester hydrolase n=1 Tax=Patiria miniata TaxID=46514 RepID=A0A913ZGI6_PATMI|nr:cholinesterase 1-like isoform X2 [Patiria miniata]